MALRQDPLMRQERRASHEKQRERRQTDIRHRVGATVLRVLTPIRKTGADLPKIRDEVLKIAHPASESYAEAARNPKPLHIARRSTKTYYMWQIGLYRPPQNTERRSTLECDSSALRTAGEKPARLLNLRTSIY